MQLKKETIEERVVVMREYVKYLVLRKLWSSEMKRDGRWSGVFVEERETSLEVERFRERVLDVSSSFFPLFFSLFPVFGWGSNRQRNIITIYNYNYSKKKFLTFYLLSFFFQKK